MPIKAIETRYKGYRFRSRLEARWAVFFDAMGWQWEYEPEGFDLGEAGWYLPDFKVYGHDSNGDFNVFYFEVKPKDKAIPERDKQKLFAFGKLCVEELITSGYGDFILLDGVPDEKLYLSAGAVVNPEKWPFEPLWWGMDVSYRQGRPTFEWLGGFCEDDRRKDYYEMVNRFGKNRYRGLTPIEKARAARFEHGEQG